MEEKSHHVDSGRAVYVSPAPSLKTNTAGSRAAHAKDATETTVVTSRTEHLTRLGLLSTMVSLTLVGFLILLDASIVSTAIPRITTTFHSLNDVGWYGTAYLLSNCALQPLTGKMYTYYNNKWTFLSFFAIFEFGSVLCGAATSSNMLIVGRAFAGMGGSGLLNGAYTIIHASVPPERKAALTGVLMSISQLGLLCGPLIGGALTQHASWRWCFYINLPCAAIVGPLLILTPLPGHDGKNYEGPTLVSSLKRLDLLGFAMFAGAAIQVLLALNWGGSSYAWNSSIIIGLFCGSGALLIVFVAWEYYMGEGAMIPFSILSRRIVWASCMNYGLFAGCSLNSTYYLPLYFQAVRDATPTMSGVDLLPSILGTMIFAMITGVLVGRVGYYLPFAVAGGALTMLGTGLLITLAPTTSTGQWIGFQILQGVGRGLGLQIPLLAVQNNTPKEKISIVTSLIVFGQNFGGAIFLSLAEVIFNASLKSELKTLSPQTSSETITAAGAAGLRNVVSAKALPSVLLAYNQAIVHVMYLAVAGAGGAFLFAFGMGWTSIKKKKDTGTEEKGI
ncbi:Major facilitator superfamily domain general substrate transporter [Penicillium hordei]|uniref:Major facilitator superfamily domain general substrate transporter n=1 Tax=Penicillium hordei TaxID=40994 RepID=A0AAD6E164_9EURO|nr:Major facilitator superfamily domain general substrate transporter [Penicillium hordei]KAJ5598454.1 Major facilitator superfamily domain general substrate transporter [Penicillium hordei]